MPLTIQPTTLKFKDSNGVFKTADCIGVNASEIIDAVDDWLDDHPDATTTVQDGAVTWGKLHSNLQDYLDIKVTSEEGNYHPEESINQIDVNGNSKAFTNILLADRQNKVQSSASNSKTDSGVTMSCQGKFFEVTGTATAGTYIGTDPEYIPVDIPAGNYKIIVYRTGAFTTTDNPYISINVKASGGTETNIGSFYISNSQDSREFSKTVSSDAVSIRVRLQIPNGFAATGTARFWVCMFPADVTITDTQTTVSDGSTETITITGAYPYGMDTMQHTSVATYRPKVQDYVDAHTVDISTEFKYLMPEMFGAVGDGNADDTAAIQACIDQAITNGVPVRMYQTYKTTGTLTIEADSFNLYAHKIDCQSATDAPALKLYGNYNHIVIDRLASNGNCIVLSTKTNVTCNRNIIETQFTGSRHGKCFVLTTENSVSTQFHNEFHFKYLYAPQSNCIYIDSDGVSAGESRFIGNAGLMSCGTWAIYIAAGNTYYFSGLQMESAVQKGVYCAEWNSGGTFENMRVQEMLDTIDSDQTDTEKGLFAKGKGVQNIRIANCNMDYKAIDVSECLDYDERVEISTATGTVGDMRELRRNLINITRYCDAEGIDEDGTTIFGSQAFVPAGTNMFVWLDKKYVVAPYGFVVDFSSTTTIPNCGLVLTNASSKILPTVMNITGDCTINLCASYNPIATNKFTVLQTNGYTAQIYDSTNTLIFDGATLGAGRYEVTSIVDPSGVPSSTTMEQKFKHLFIGDNMIWLVNRLS